MAAPNSKVSLKLLIHKDERRVLFAEASKDFIDFLFTLLTLPIGTVIRLLQNKPMAMAGSFANLYQSVIDLKDDHIHPNQHKDVLLNPKSSLSFLCPLISPLPLEQCSSPVTTATKFYKCNNCTHTLLSSVSRKCPDCRYTMSTVVQHYVLETDHDPAVAADGGGFVNGVVTYIVLDNLVVAPMSTISTITLLNKFKVKDLSALEEKVVDFGVDEGMALLKNAWSSETVLTNVFLSEVSKVNGESKLISPYMEEMSTSGKHSRNRTSEACLSEHCKSGKPIIEETSNFQNAIEKSILIEDDDERDVNVHQSENAKDANEDMRRNTRRRLEHEDDQLIPPPKIIKWQRVQKKSPRKDPMKLGRIWTRMPTKQLVSTINSLNAEQREAVKEMGFESILDFNITKIPNRMGYWLVENFNQHNCSLELQDTSIKITRSSIKDVLGVPMGSLQIKMLKYCKRTNNLIIEWRKQFESGSRIFVNDVINRIKTDDQAGTNFKLNFLALFVSVMVEGISCGTINQKFITSLEKVEDIKELDWCGYILDSLKRSKDYWDRGSNMRVYTGPLAFLTVFYVSSTKTKRTTIQQKGTIPAIKDWTDEKLKSREIEEVESGGFGKAPIYRHREAYEDETIDEDNMLAQWWKNIPKRKREEEKDQQVLTAKEGRRKNSENAQEDPIKTEPFQSEFATYRS